MSIVVKGLYAGEAIYTKQIGTKDVLIISTLEKQTTSSYKNIKAYITSDKASGYELLTGGEKVNSREYSVKVKWKSGSESVVSLNEYHYTVLVNSFYTGSTSSFQKDIQSAEKFDQSWDMLWKVGGGIIFAAYCLFYIFGGDW